ncbi:MAG TPA: hypothetical protein VFU37_20250 [Pyrinomonadaceae bacterium]|nr:hypothetical protein [Pyrinomonadaceae bacterium]
MRVIKLWFSTIKSTLTNLTALAIFVLIYLLLLATFFKFIWTREATVWQVMVTYSFMVLIPAEFFIFQAAIIDRVRDGKFRWRTILIDAVKFFIITIPVLLLAWLINYLLNKWQLRYPPPVVPSLPVASGPAPLQPIHWPSLLFATLRFVLLGIALPLATIHFWIAFAGGEVRALFAGGAASFFKRFGAAFTRAFASESVLIYALGMLVFFMIPYAILFIPIAVRGNKTDFALFIVRLSVTFVFSLIGWVVTISALTRKSLGTAPDSPTNRSPAVAMEAAA